MADPSITCPRCGLTSFNLNDIEQNYCGNCHMFHAQMGMCHCGRPLHYTNKDIQRRVEELVLKKGEWMLVTDSQGRKWRVQRHYIALHGIKEQELETYGFERIL